MSWQLIQHPLASVAFRSCLLLAITLVVAFVLRRRSAAVGHHVWVLGFCGCLLIPIVMLFAPNVAVPVLPPAAPRVAAAAPPLGLTLEPTNRETVPLRSLPPMSNEIPETASDAELAQPPRASKAALPAAIQPATIKPAISAWPAWPTRLLLVWAAGVAVCGARLLWQVRQVRRAALACPELESDTWHNLCEEVARELRVRQAISLRTHREALTPMVVGFWRPLVLVPSDAERWSSEQQRHVLLHELAHVQRHDVLAQLLAGSACVLYWFNPLAWWGAVQMRRLREIACDDVVVRHAQRPSTYAQTLLDVAKQYRCRQQVFSVAMARNAQVEGRIRAILDATRERASLTKRNARIVGMAAVVILMVVGTLQLTSRAEETENAAKSPETNQSQADKSQADKSTAEKPQVEKPKTEDPAAQEEPSAPRTMTVRVLDHAGNPIREANVYASIWAVDPESKRPPNRNYTTNEQGVAQVEIPQRLRIMRLWPSKAGYVPLFVNFAEGTHEDGRLLPEVYEFRLQPGTRLSGVIVDEAGKPVADARVQVKVVSEYEHWGANPKPIVSTWLAEDEGAAITDMDGRWEITNAPAPREKSDYRFQLVVTHPDFAGDTEWGELQTQQGITTKELRAGTARLTLDRGFVITGSITGPDGQPVTEGLVIWDDRPYWGQAVNETQIDAKGKYESLRLAPGEYPITVLAPGFAPEQRKIQVNAALEEVDFQLEPGHPITIKIVDQDGKPIPNAGVYIGEWRGTEAIFNQDHPNVPDSRIPRKADQDGIYRWTWAPADGVGYRIGKIGYAMKELTLVARPEPHTVVLPAPVTIFGRVTDAETGEGIERFRVIPVTAFHPDFYSTDFQDGRLAEGRDGDYRIVFDAYGQTENRYRVRIEADGYRTAIGQKSLGRGDEPLEENFTLEKVPPLRSAVVDASGAPVNKFTVAVGTPTTSPGFSFDHADASFGVAFPVEGRNTFELPATFEPQRIRVFNDTAFAEVVRERDEPIETITLRPWASVSGRLVQDGKPIVNMGVYLMPLAHRGLTEARFQEGYSTKTDLDGKFRFERVPPMRASVRPALGPWQDSALTSGESVPLDLKPGEHREITLGGGKATVLGQVVAVGDHADKLSKRWSLNYLISRDRGVDYPADATPLGFSFVGPVQASWLRQDGFQRWVATRENHFVKLADDGRMAIHGVRPGEYDLVIQLYEQPAGCLVETIGTKVMPVMVAEGDTEFVVGVDAYAEPPTNINVAKRAIVVPVQRGPRVGSDMRAYQFTDADGRVRLVHNLEGRYVLLDVWASWCQPCLASMPALKATVEKYADKPLTVVGLNVDKTADATVAKALAKEGGWNWAQNYLGDNSDLMRQLGVSSVPAYYLIGPDGKLLGSANAWEQMHELLGAELSKGSE